MSIAQQLSRRRHPDTGSNVWVGSSYWLVMALGVLGLRGASSSWLHRGAIGVLLPAVAVARGNPVDQQDVVLRMHPATVLPGDALGLVAGSDTPGLEAARTEDGS